MSLTELLGYLAASLVLATFSVRSITTLRSVAIVSNLLFIGYAASAQLLPVLILHALLLPLNMWRLRQAVSDPEGIDDPASHRETAWHSRNPWGGPHRFRTPIAPSPSPARTRPRRPARRRPARAIPHRRAS